MAPFSNDTSWNTPILKEEFISRTEKVERKVGNQTAQGVGKALKAVLNHTKFSERVFSCVIINAMNFNVMPAVRKFWAENWTVLSLLAFFVVLAPFVPEELDDIPSMVDWKTVGALVTLLLITTAMRLSGHFDAISRKTVRSISTERRLALVLTGLTAFLSTFLTNDIALFIVVPLTLGFQKILKNDLTKIVIFEAIGANVGSTLTPIGNPQNLFIWHRWGISFLSFVWKMLPLVLILMGILGIFVLINFSDNPLKLNEIELTPIDRRLTRISVIAMFVYFVILELRMAEYAFFVALPMFWLIKKDVVRQADWRLILIFILMFIDFHLLAKIDFIDRMFGFLRQAHSREIFVTSVVNSQFMSNVPAAIFISKFSSDWFAMAYGVNVGGNGTLVASLANLIAVRLTGKCRLCLKFHSISMVYLLVSVGIVFAIFFA